MRDSRGSDALWEFDCEVQLPGGGHGGQGEEIGRGIAQVDVLDPRWAPDWASGVPRLAAHRQHEGGPGSGAGTGIGTGAAATGPRAAGGMVSAWLAEQEELKGQIESLRVQTQARSELIAAGKATEAAIQTQLRAVLRLGDLDCSRATFRSGATFRTEPRASPSQDAPTPEAVEIYEQQPVGSSNPVQVGGAFPGWPIVSAFVENVLDGFSLESLLSADISASAGSAVSERFSGGGASGVSSCDMLNRNRDIRRTECNSSQALPAPVVARREEMRSSSVRFRQIATSRLLGSSSSSSSTLVGSQGDIVDQVPVPMGKGRGKGKRDSGQ